jgi:hypothetical protein
MCKPVHMPTTMALWRLAADGSATPVLEVPLSAEAIIESAVESAPEILGIDVLIVGRQVSTPSGPLDLLAIDGDARLVVVENKREKTPREVLAQVIDYASYVATLSVDEVSAIYAAYQAQRGEEPTDFAEAFELRFGLPLEAIGDTPAMVIVASRLDDSTERMIAFLDERFGVPVNAALFQPFSDGLVGRTWLRAEVSSRVRSGAGNSQAREESKSFWDAWLPVGRKVLPDVKLPAAGPRAVWISRRIIPGISASLTLWVSSTEAYAEVQFEDEQPSVNERVLKEIAVDRTAIEQDFGGPLDWRGPEPGSSLTRRTKIVTPKVAIGQRTNPSETGLAQLADVARRLVDAVKPHLASAFDRAVVSDDELDATDPAHVSTTAIPEVPLAGEASS